MIFEKIRERLIAKRDSICKTKNDCIALSDAEVNGVTFANFDEAIDIINQVEAEYNNGWIPCSERLPQNAEWVLCYGKNREGEFKYEVSDYIYEINGWMCSRIKEVIAWQPLPQPPKGE